MDASGAAIQALPRSAEPRTAWAGTALAHGLNGLLGVVALVLLLRSVGGGFTAPHVGWFALATIIVMVLLAAAVRRFAGWRPAGARQPAVLAVQYGPALALAAAIVALVVAGAEASIVTAGTLVVLCEESYGWWKIRTIRPTVKHQEIRSHGDSRVIGEAPRPALAAPRPEVQPTHQPLRAAPGPAADGTDDEADVVQHVLRIEGPDGTPRWQGWCRTRFEPSSRHAVEHLSFCPPFEQTPRVACRPLSGPSVRLRVSRVLPHGASVELRLSSPSAEPATVTFAFSASVGPS